MKEVENIFEKLGCNIPPNGIKFVRFSRRKDCQQVLAVKKDLQEIKIEDVDLPGQKKLFINQNCYLYYKVLWSKSEKLHSLGKINCFFISGDAIKIKVSENSLPLTITLAEDFAKYFPNIDLSIPERAISINASVCCVNHDVIFSILFESTF